MLLSGFSSAANGESPIKTLFLSSVIDKTGNLCQNKEHVFPFETDAFHYCLFIIRLLHNIVLAKRFESLVSPLPYSGKAPIRMKSFRIGSGACALLQDGGENFHGG